MAPRGGGFLSASVLFYHFPFPSRLSSALDQLKEFWKKLFSVFSLVVRGSPSCAHIKLWTSDDFCASLRERKLSLLSFYRKVRYFLMCNRQKDFLIVLQCLKAFVCNAKRLGKQWQCGTGTQGSQSARESRFYCRMPLLVLCSASHLSCCQRRVIQELTNRCKLSL